MDIKTKKGKISLMHEQHMLEYINFKLKKNKTKIVQTLKNRTADCDGFLVKNNEIIGLFESKCRDLSHVELINFGSWLITYDKLEKCRNLSLALQIPFYGFLYLLKDKKVLSWKIAEKGVYCFDFKKENTQTQETINGGLVKRINAYLPIKYSKII